MYIGHGRLYLCLSVPRHISTLLHGPGCKLRECYGWVPSSYGLLGGFATGARVSLLRSHSSELEMSASACTRSVPGYVCNNKECID